MIPKPLLLLLGTPFLVAMAACRADQEPTPSCCAGTPAAATPLPGTSLYQLIAQCRDQTGSTRSLADFRGRPIVISMVFTHCAYACPTIAANLTALLPQRPERQDLHVVLVSMDPARDDPAALAAFAARHHLGADRYTLLTSTPDAVAEIAAVLGIRFAAVEGGDFSHSNVLTLLDRDGTIVHRLEGLDADPAPLLAALDELPPEPAPRR